MDSSSSVRSSSLSIRETPELSKVEGATSSPQDKTVAAAAALPRSESTHLGSSESTPLLHRVTHKSSPTQEELKEGAQEQLNNIHFPPRDAVSQKEFEATYMLEDVPEAERDNHVNYTNDKETLSGVMKRLDKLEWAAKILEDRHKALEKIAQKLEANPTAKVDVLEQDPKAPDGTYNYSNRNKSFFWCPPFLTRVSKKINDKYIEVDFNKLIADGSKSNTEKAKIIRDMIANEKEAFNHTSKALSRECIFVKREIEKAERAGLNPKTTSNEVAKVAKKVFNKYTNLGENDTIVFTKLKTGINPLLENVNKNFIDIKDFLLNLKELADSTEILGNKNLAREVRQYIFNIIDTDAYKAAKKQSLKEMASQVEVVGEMAISNMPKAREIATYEFLDDPNIEDSDRANRFLSDFDQTPHISSVDGKIIEFEFKNKENTVVLKERTERASTVKTLTNGLKSKLKYLQRIQTSTSSNITEEIAKTTKQLAAYEETSGEATWASTNAAKMALFRFGPAGYKEASVPVLANLRMQKVIQDGKVVSAITRSGAVTDFSHHEVSLQELQDYEFLVKLRDQGVDTYSLEKKKELFALYDLVDEEGNLIPKMLEATVEWIAKAAIQSYGDEILEDNSTDICLKKLDNIISSRSERLEQQVLQDLFLHFQTNPVTGSETLYGRTALVNTKKARDVKNGFVTDESTQAFDMKAIYDKFQGKEVVFDVDNDGGPFIGLKGEIHMPKNCCSDRVNKTTLNTVFFNFSVQLDKENSGAQKAINDAAFAKLEKFVEANEIQTVKEMYFSEETGDKAIEKAPFNVASQIAILISKHGYASMNCYGGKDRTGYALAKVTEHYLETVEENENTLNEWRRKLVGVKGTAALVVEDNASHKALKLMDLNLDLFMTDTLKGMAKRIATYLRAAWSFVAKHKSNADQLYHTDSKENIDSVGDPEELKTRPRLEKHTFTKIEAEKYTQSTFKLLAARLQPGSFNSSSENLLG